MPFFSFRHIYNLTMVSMERGSSEVIFYPEVVSTSPRVKDIMVPIYKPQ